MKRIIVFVLVLMCTLCAVSCAPIQHAVTTEQAGLGINWWGGYNPYDTYLYHTILGHEIINCVN